MTTEYRSMIERMKAKTSECFDVLEGIHAKLASMPRTTTVADVIAHMCESTSQLAFALEYMGKLRLSEIIPIPVQDKELIYDDSNPAYMVKVYKVMGNDKELMHDQLFDSSSAAARYADEFARISNFDCEVHVFELQPANEVTEHYAIKPVR